MRTGKERACYLEYLSRKGGLLTSDNSDTKNRRELSERRTGSLVAVLNPVIYHIKLLTVYKIECLDTLSAAILG